MPAEALADFRGRGSGACGLYLPQLTLRRSSRRGRLPTRSAPALARPPLNARRPAAPERLAQAARASRPYRPKRSPNFRRRGSSVRGGQVLAAVAEATAAPAPCPKAAERALVRLPQERLTQATRRLAGVPAEALAGFPPAWVGRGREASIGSRELKIAIPAPPPGVAY